MHKGIVAYVAVIIIILALWYFTIGFKFPSQTRTTTTVSGSNTPITTGPSTTTSIPIYNISCSRFGLFNTTGFNSNQSATCEWSGGILGFWVASGAAQYEHVSVTGANGITYVNQSSEYSCPVLFSNFTAPKDNLTIKLYIAPKANTTTKCGEVIAKFNTTTVAPKNATYTQVFNGNFVSGTYTGWSYTGRGFNVSPMSIVWADNNGCYLGNQWSNYNFSYFATTYDCGTTVAAGNLTSSLFLATQPYLNFRIISDNNNELYITILTQNGTRAITAYYDTFTNTSQGYSTFRNASIPMTTVFNKPVRIRIVSVPSGRTVLHTYIAASGFALSGAPHQDKGILLNETFNTSAH